MTCFLISLLSSLAILPSTTVGYCTNGGANIIIDNKLVFCGKCPKDNFLENRSCVACPELHYTEYEGIFTSCTDNFDGGILSPPTTLRAVVDPHNEHPTNASYTNPASNTTHTSPSLQAQTQPAITEYTTEAGVPSVTQSLANDATTGNTLRLPAKKLSYSWVVGGSIVFVILIIILGKYLKERAEVNGNTSNNPNHISPNTTNTARNGGIILRESPCDVDENCENKDEPLNPNTSEQIAMIPPNGNTPDPRHDDDANGIDIYRESQV